MFKNLDVMTDLQKIIRIFDNFLDNVYEKGAFDVTKKEDKEIEDFVSEMKKKYL